MRFIDLTDMADREWVVFITEIAALCDTGEYRCDVILKNGTTIRAKGLSELDGVCAVLSLVQASQSLLNPE